MKRVIQVVIIVCVFVLWAPVGYACFCTKPEVQDAYVRARTVFLGEVLEVIPPRGLNPNGEFASSAHSVKFKVEKMWKGFLWPEITVLTRLDSCFGLGRRLEKGQKYLVYAESYPSTDALSTELIVGGCTRTTLLSGDNVSDDIRALNSIMATFGLRPRSATLPMMNFLEPEN